MRKEVCVVIRSVKERTEELCKKLIVEQGVPESQVFIVHEVPFAASMRKGFELGIESNCQWTYCIDADVLLRPGSMAQMLEAAQRADGMTCELQGVVYDKFFGGARPAGNHFYRTSLLKEAVKRIPEEGVNVRPEYHTLQAMKQDGFNWCDLNIPVGLHDSEQYYRDIYRKCFVQAHKHAYLAEMFLGNWKARLEGDPDMRVALAGFSDGIKHAGGVRIDITQTYYSDNFQRLGVDEKGPLDLSDWDGARVAQIIQEWEVPEAFRRYFPAAVSQSVERPRSKFQRLNSSLRKRGPLLGAIYLVAAVLNKLSARVMRVCD